MAIDKSNSKPWVKITVWILTGALMFAFMGTGVWYLIANGKYLFSTESYHEPTDEAQVSDDDMIRAYEEQIAGLEKEVADGADDKAALLAGMNASYAAWIYQRGNVADFPYAITLVKRAIELDPETHASEGQAFIDMLQGEIDR
ncbi:MAG: hypothetical protein FWD41_03375 [Actinomycetia bacterium]|nr:hypothetical protein [Actinomycetes bacterium]